MSQPVRFSSLKRMAQSPAHYKYWLGQEFKPTPAMLIGTAVHDMILGGTNRIVSFGGVRRGKAWDAFSTENADAVILNDRELDLSVEIAEGVRTNAHAMSLLTPRENVLERRINWTLGDLECRGTPDAVGESTIADLKVTNTADPRRFVHHAVRMNWHAQLAWYSEGLERAGYPRPTSHYIVAVESSPPYPVVVYSLTSDAIEAGEMAWRSWVEQLLVCQSANHWPGYAQTVVPFNVEQEMTVTIDGEEITV